MDIFFGVVSMNIFAMSSDCGKGAKRVRLAADILKLVFHHPNLDTFPSPTSGDMVPFLHRPAQVRLSFGSGSGQVYSPCSLCRGRVKEIVNF